MLVYSTRLWLSSHPDIAFQQIADWLSHKMGEKINYRMLKMREDIRPARNNGHRVIGTGWQTDNYVWRALRHIQPDEKVNGRRWITEIGMKYPFNEEGEFECTVLLRVSDNSPEIQERVYPSRPLFIPPLLKHCQPTAKTPGTDVVTLSIDNYETLKYRIHDEERQHAIVVLSPTKEGIYPIAPPSLHFQLIGLTDLFLIGEGVNTLSLAELVGEKYIPYHGAANIIYPDSRFSRNNGGYPTYRILLDTLEEWSEQEKPETKFLSKVTYRMNVPNSWQHISPEKVREIRLHHAIDQRLPPEEFAAALEELKQTHAQLASEMEDDITAAQELGLETEQKLEETREELKRTRNEFEAYKLRYQYDRAELSDGPLTDEVRMALIDCIDHDANHLTPEKILILINNLFPDRVVILDSAWSRVKESDEFRNRKKAFSLLWRLVTKYWSSLADGGNGDEEARRIFGDDEFAAKESETVMRNPAKLWKRNFAYKGEDVPMLRHLKYGGAYSAAKTLRIHFHWDHEDKKIVVGHCGPHL